MALAGKQKFAFSILAIVLVSLLLPDIVSNFMIMGKESVALSTGYYVRYISYLVSAHISLLYLAFLSYVMFIKK